MKVSEFIKWLETQDQDATVEVLHHTSGSGYCDQGGWCSTAEFTIDEANDTGYNVGKDYAYGKHYEYNVYSDGTKCLTIGTKDN
jgi:hypothetical protein